MHSMSIDSVKKRSSTASLRTATGCSPRRYSSRCRSSSVIVSRRQRSSCSRFSRLSFGALTSWLLLYDWAETSIYCCLVTGTHQRIILWPITSDSFSGRQTALQLFKSDLVRLRRTTRHENRLPPSTKATGQSYGTSIVGRRLLGDRG